MKLKWIASLVGAGLVFAFLAGLYFRGDQQTSDPGPGTRVIIDMKGRNVRLADPLQRIALLGGPTGQVAFILGVEERLCAVTNTLRLSQLVREICPAVSLLPGPRTTNGNINIEELIASDPDIVVAGDLDGNIVLSKTRIPVAFLSDSMGEGMADIQEEIRFYGYLFRAQARAEAYTAFLDRVIALVRERTATIPNAERKSVFQGYGPSRLVTLGGDTFMQERIEVAGCTNAAQSVTTIGKRTGLHSGLGEVSMEQVLAWDPDILIINFGGSAGLASHPQWRHVKAVQTAQVHPQPAGVFIFNRPTAESAVIFPLWLAALAYPDRFSDISVHGIVRQFYKEIMGFDLTRAQVGAILDGSYEFKIMRGKKRHG